MLCKIEYPETLEYSSDGVLNELLPSKLNKLKKSNIEAYFFVMKFGNWEKLIMKMFDNELTL